MYICPLRAQRYSFKTSSFIRYLYAFEVHEKGKPKQSAKESPSGGWQNRRKRNTEERSSEERERAVAEKPPAKVLKPAVKEEEPEDVEKEEVTSQNNDTKSETSDQDSSSQVSVK